jgi:hypothetical protein
VIPQRGPLQRGLIVLSSAGGSIIEMTLGMWRGGAGRRWLVPLAIFLCVTGLILILAVSVEALAPFIYAIF